MRKLVILLVSCFLTLNILGQQSRKVSLFFNFQANKTVYDRVMQNANGAGPGLELFLNTSTKFKPILEFNWDLFSTSDVMISKDGNELVKKRSVPSIFIGASYNPLNRLYITFTLGPSFINSEVYLGIKPCVGYYFGRKERFTAKISLTNIFERDAAGNEPFGYMNFGLGARLF
ncbi:MAG: hypothetical protein WCR72_15970 [Bacteroidota bacterium]